MRIAPPNAPFRQSAFTMVEIAIALAVIGFALMAIVGMLPQGLRTQKDNREDTIVSQDGAYIMEAIRGGAVGLDTLTNFVDRIVITRMVPRGSTTAGYSNFVSGSNIVRLLSTPKYFTTNQVSSKLVIGTNIVIAYVRALSGSALTVGANNKTMAFQYRLQSELIPFLSSAPYQTTNIEWFDPTNRSVQIQQYASNVFEVRLSVTWPLLPNGTVSSTARSAEFRSLVSGTRTSDGYFAPLTYQFTPPTAQ